MHRTAMIALLILQAFVAAFVLLHDWLPLGCLNNDNRGVREVDPLAKRIRVTLFSALPFVIGLAWSIAVVHRPRLPMGLDIFLCITYLVALYGLLRAWSLDPGPGPCRALSHHVRRNPPLPARAQRHRTRHAACDAAPLRAWHTDSAGASLSVA